MIALIQRVTRAAVSVGAESVAEIGPGLVALIGVERGDREVEAARLAERVLGYRVFADAEDRMNLSLLDTSGSLLAVPQFTLAADTASGARPSFSSAAPPEEGERLFNCLVDFCRQAFPRVATGRFGAHMQLLLVNDGPVTFWLRAAPKRGS